MVWDRWARMTALVPDSTAKAASSAPASLDRWPWFPRMRCFK